MSGKHWLMLRWIAEALQVTTEEEGQCSVDFVISPDKTMRLIVVSDKSFISIGRVYTWAIQVNKGEVKVDTLYTDLPSCIHDLLVHVQENELAAELTP